MRMLQAASGRAAAVKFQLSMFERYGSRGFVALERALYAARQMELITIVDCLHGGLSTTISAIAADIPQYTTMTEFSAVLLAIEAVKKNDYEVMSIQEHSRELYELERKHKEEGEEARAQ